tara:strand:+ start:151 stop:660 length:510 start_codon:yes stop_codon:yes gene_type:complete
MTIIKEDRKEYIKEYCKARYQATKEERLAWQKAYDEDNKEKIKAYRKANEEKKKAYDKAYYKANKEKRTTQKKVWRKSNKDKECVSSAKRRALKFRATIYLTATDKKEIDNLYKLAQDKTKETETQWHVDHIIPLTKGGLHKPTNLQVVPASWNISKGNRSEDKYNDYY